MREKDRNWFIKALTSPYLWAGLLGGAGGGTAFAYSMLLGSLWWRPFYKWQSLIAGLLALVGAGIAFFAVRQQIRAAKEIEATRQETEKDRALSSLLADLSVDALELHTVHSRMLKTSSSFDEKVLSQHINKLLRSTPRLIGLLDMDNQLMLRRVLACYRDSELKKCQHVLLFSDRQGRLTIDNIDIPEAIYKWSRLHQMPTSDDLETTLRKMPSAKLQPESQTADSSPAPGPVAVPAGTKP